MSNEAAACWGCGSTNPNHDRTCQGDMSTHERSAGPLDVEVLDNVLLLDSDDDRALLERIAPNFANWAPGHAKQWAASIVAAIEAERTRPERMRRVYARLAEEARALPPKGLTDEH